MARDYAKKPADASKHSVPGWVWMLVGLLVGLFVAFLVYLNQPGLPVEPASAPEPRKQAAPKAPSEVEETAQATAPKALNFDFYNMLPSFEVPVPEPKPERPEATKAPEKQPTLDEDGVYVLQAGSFQKAKDADRRRAQLALLGIVSKVQKVTVDGSKTWHRVRAGPYRKLEQLNRVRNLLRENEIEYMLLKQRS